MVLRARLRRDEGEQRFVDRLAQARKAPRDLVLRARMLELSWSGQRAPSIAEKLRCSPQTVRWWLHLFNRLGLQGLDDLGGQVRRSSWQASHWPTAIQRRATSSWGTMQPMTQTGRPTPLTVRSLSPISDCSCARSRSGKRS
ncbi:helix-turn-helix domain-containing protein [Streptomyces sp. SAS_267]|uniref:helix-turn-helix domain-containing protein n=1 Tax=Streptomyces sp. SAS_267 TaxID=3412750 RepID=UPI00403D213A